MYLEIYLALYRHTDNPLLAKVPASGQRCGFPTSGRTSLQPLPLICSSSFVCHSPPTGSRHHLIVIPASLPPINKCLSIALHGKIPLSSCSHRQTSSFSSVHTTEASVTKVIVLVKANRKSSAFVSLCLSPAFDTVASCLLEMLHYGASRTPHSWLL